jgi:FeS assembly SUF system protein
MFREAASRLLGKTGLFDATKPRPHPEDGQRAISPPEQAPAGPAEAPPENERRAISKDEPQQMREGEQDFMAQEVTQSGEPQAEHRHDYFDFAPEPPPETEGVERPEGEDDSDLYEPVLDALRTVRDPEIPVNIVELGLIYELVVKQGGIVYVEMTLTTPACPVAQSMPGEVENAAASVPGVSDVRVKLVWTPPWDRDRMSEEAKLELGLL